MFKPTSMLTRLAEFAPTLPLADCQTDLDLINLWLANKTAHTRRAYERDATMFLAFIEGKPLAQVKVNDLENFLLALAHSGYARDTIRRRLNGIKSLLSYGQRVGYLQFNVGKAVQTPPSTNALADRIAPESTIAILINAASPGRDRLILKFLYKVGCRVSELCALKWKDLQQREVGGQVTLLGKGEKVRTVLIPLRLWDELMAFKGKAPSNNPAFPTKSGRHFNPRNIRDIIYRATQKAGLTEKISPHWLRHAHASHSLERGAKIHLVSDTLGHSSIAVTGRYLHARPSDSSSLYLPD